MTTKEIKDRDAAEKAKAAPITLPAGSYTLEDTEKPHPAAVQANPEDRHRAVDPARAQATPALPYRPTQGPPPGMTNTPPPQQQPRPAQPPPLRPPPPPPTPH